MELFNNEKLLPFKFPQMEGYSYQYNEELKAFDIRVPNGFFRYSEHYMNSKESDYTINYLLESDIDWKKADWRSIKPENIQWSNIQWRHDEIKIFGKKTLIPRYSSWYGDPDKPYTYSGLTLQPNEWNKGLLYLKDKMEKLAGTEFNSVLLNWYRDGKDYMGWHTDAEASLGKNPVIGSVNFGASRRFVLRRIDNKKVKIEFPLKHGTFLAMMGETQHYWQHTVPKQMKVHDLRVNLTFRVIKN